MTTHTAGTVVASSRWSIRWVLANTMAVANKSPGTNQTRELTFGLVMKAVLTAGLVWMSGATRVWVLSGEQGIVVSGRLSRIGYLRARILGHVVVAVVWSVSLYASWLPLGVALVVICVLALRVVVLCGLQKDAAGAGSEATHFLTDLVTHANQTSGQAVVLIEQMATRESVVVAASCSMELWHKLYEPLATKSAEVGGRAEFVLRPKQAPD